MNDSRRPGKAAPQSKPARPSRLRLPQLRRRKEPSDRTGASKREHAVRDQAGRPPSAKLPEAKEPARRYDTQGLQGQNPPAGSADESTEAMPDVRQAQTAAFTPEQPAEINKLLEEERRRIAGGGKISGEQDEGDQGC